MWLPLSAVAVAGQVRQGLDSGKVDQARKLELPQRELRPFDLEEDRSRQAEQNAVGRNPAVAGRDMVGTDGREWLSRVFEATGYHQTLDWDEMDVESGDIGTPADKFGQ